MQDILHEIADDKGVEIIDLTVHPDHIHLSFSSPPKHTPAHPASWFNGTSARKYNHRYADHEDEQIKWARDCYAGIAGNVSTEAVEKHFPRHEEDEQ